MSSVQSIRKKELAARNADRQRIYDQYQPPSGDAQAVQQFWLEQLDKLCAEQLPLLEKVYQLEKTKLAIIDKSGRNGIGRLAFPDEHPQQSTLPTVLESISRNAARVKR